VRSQWLEALGIPASYGTEPALPVYELASELVDVEPNIVGATQRLAPAAAVAWRAMRSRAADDQVQLLLVSGYRSLKRQAQLIQRKLDRGVPLAEILATHAAPGYSQHHTGCAVDVATPGCPPLVGAFVETDAFRWLERHARDFDFVMPYGRDNPVGFAFEPWHWYYGAD